MKLAIVLLSMFMTVQIHAWSCSLTTYDDPSSVDRCYGRILDHWIHKGKSQIVYHWQYYRTEESGTLAKAGEQWNTQGVQDNLKSLKALTDAKDHLSRDRVYQDSPSTLTCSSSSSSGS